MKRVVVVDDEDHGRPPSAAARPPVGAAGVARHAGWRRRRHAGRQLDRATQRRGLVLGLLELALGDAAGDDPGAGVDVGLARPCRTALRIVIAVSRLPS